MYQDDPILEMNIRQTRIVMGCVLVILVLAGGNLYQFVRGRDRITVTESSTGRTVILDNRNYGASDLIRLSSDGPTDDDRSYCARRFIDLLYDYTPERMTTGYEAAARMMTVESVHRFKEILEGHRVLETELRQSATSKWTITDISFKPGENTVRIQGDQEISRVVAGETKHEKRSWNFEVLLIQDPDGRTDDNQRTGFMVAGLSPRENGKRYEVLPTPTFDLGAKNDAAHQP